VMSRLVDTVSPDDEIGVVSERIRSGEHGAFPVVDSDGKYVGMVTRRDLLTNDHDHDHDAPVVEIASAYMVKLGPEASLVDAMQLMAQEDVTHIPVIEGGKLVGVCTRADIVRSRSDELALERLEPGWIGPVAQLRDRHGKRLLIVGNKSLGGEALMAEVASQIRRNPFVRFHVVVPLSTGGDLTGARKRLETQLGLIEDLHASASGEIGRSDPLGAIEAALRREPATGIILSTLPPSRSRWLRSNLPTGVSRQVDLPCVTVHDHDGAAGE
jgi:CBS domain-containing protein